MTKHKEISGRFSEVYHKKLGEWFYNVNYTGTVSLATNEPGRYIVSVHLLNLSNRWDSIGAYVRQGEGPTATFQRVESSELPDDTNLEKKIQIALRLF